MAVRVEKTDNDRPFLVLLGEAEQQCELKRFGKEWRREFIPLNQINVCGQQRRDFDEESLDVLGNSIEQEGQFHDLLVMRMPLEMAKRYVELTNECWGTDVDFNTFFQRGDGYYDILDAGERRLRSMRKKEEDLGDPPGTYGVDCKVRYASLFAEVIKIQFDENLHEGVAPHQAAKSIRQAFYIGKKEGLFSNVQEFLKFSALKEDATRKALAYFELPTQVREMVESEKGGLTYSMAIELVPLMRAAYEYYTRTLLQSDDVDGQLRFVTAEHVIANAQSLVLTEASIVARKINTEDRDDRWTRGQARRYLVGRTAELKAQGSFDEFTLKSAAGIEADQQRSEERRLNSLQKLAENLAGLIMHLRENGIELEVDIPADLDPVSREQQMLLGL